MDQRLRFLAYASRQNQASFWPSRFDRTKPTNRTSAVAQVVIFNNHSFDLWTPMWQSQIEQESGFFQRIGTVRNDKPVTFLISQGFHRARMQRVPDGGSDIGRIDIRDLRS